MRFAICDQGPGIPAQQLPYIFDRYWQAERGDRRGVGLGLYVVKGIIEAHGGTLRVESEPGRGSSFSFELDAAADTAWSERTPEPGTTTAH